MRIERITSSTSGETQCPIGGSIIAAGRKKYPVESGQIKCVPEEELTTEKTIDETFLHLTRVNLYISNGNGELGIEFG